MAGFYADRGRRNEAAAELKPCVKTLRTPSRTSIWRASTTWADSTPTPSRVGDRSAPEPSSLPAQNLIGNIRFAQGKLDEAERAYLKTLAINPNYAPAHNDLGNLYAKRGRVDSAAGFLRALQLDPNLELAKRNGASSEEAVR